LVLLTMMLVYQRFDRRQKELPLLHTNGLAVLAEAAEISGVVTRTPREPKGQSAEVPAATATSTAEAFTAPEIDSDDCPGMIRDTSPRVLSKFRVKSND